MHEALTRWCLDLQAHTGLSSIVLGGRRAWQETAVEPKASDVDLYAFCGDGLYARMPRLADTLRGAGVRRVVRGVPRSWSCTTCSPICPRSI